VRIASEDEKEILGEIRRLADVPQTKTIEEILIILGELKDDKDLRSDEELLELVKKLQDKLKNPN
jgi:hypothetical protein